ncbi:MAG: adenylate/guanylate cyclase domain-containing protein [Rhizobiaceae bacterium]
MTPTPVQIPPNKPKRTISLRWLMMLGFGGLVALSIGGVLAMSVTANFRNTFSLLNEQTLQMISGMERSIKSEMAQVEFAVSGLQKLFGDGSFDINQDQDRQQALRAVLRTVEVIEKIQLTDIDGTVTAYARQVRGDIIKLPPERQAAPANLAELPPKAGGSQPLWLGESMRNGRLSHDVVQNITANGRVIGQIKATIGGYSINRLISSLAQDDKTTAFVLDSDGKLIAHSSRSSQFRDTPRYEVADFPSLGMKQFATADLIPTFADDGTTETRYKVHRTRNGQDGSAGENNFFYITLQMPVFSSAPYTLGAYVKGSDINDELRRAGFTVVVGLVALLITVLVAIFLSHRLSKPMRRIADATNRFSRLDLEGFEPLPKSRVRELDTQAGGINSMHTALSQFSKYVPQKLVQRILESGDEVTRPVERPVTVMFTDIANFTAGAEDLDAAAITSMLNEHFELISSQISKSHGTVDKYLGDGVMAFWGAPETDDDHALHAIEAAIAIKQVFEAQCHQRRADQLPSLQLRIGIHSGRAIVGNIGGDDRTNYTVLGHTVNVANRIEQLGKEFIESSDAIVAVSSECFEAAGQPADFTAVGARVVRGSSKPVALLIHETNRGDNVVDIRTTAT